MHLLPLAKALPNHDKIRILPNDPPPLQNNNDFCVPATQFLGGSKIQQFKVL